MRLLISGACGFVGHALARALAESGEGHAVVGVDNFIRPGSEGNRDSLKRLGVRLVHADARSASDIDALPACDWVLDAAALPSVLAGVDGTVSSRQLVEHNLLATVNLLEFCRRHAAGFTLLSTSRVYAIDPLARLPVTVRGDAYCLDADQARGPGAGSPPSAALPPGISAAGITEAFSTRAPVSLYGATKLASETLALEYGAAYGLPVFVNRCGVLAGPGQFGRPDQGIFAYWINAFLRRRPLRYLGFDGQGHQVRDCLHPRDLLPLLRSQFGAPRLAAEDRIVNVSGGAPSALSLRQLSAWCAGRFGPHPVAGDPTQRPFDLPWVVLDSGRAAALWNWTPRTAAAAILEEIAVHAEANPDWLERSAQL